MANDNYVIQSDIDSPATSSRLSAHHPLPLLRRNHIARAFNNVKPEPKEREPYLRKPCLDGSAPLGVSNPRWTVQRKQLARTSLPHISTIRQFSIKQQVEFCPREIRPQNRLTVAIQPQSHGSGDPFDAPFQPFSRSKVSKDFGCEQDGNSDGESTVSIGRSLADVLPKLRGPRPGIYECSEFQQPRNACPFTSQMAEEMVRLREKHIDIRECRKGYTIPDAVLLPQKHTLVCCQGGLRKWYEMHLHGALAPAFVQVAN